MVSGTLPNRKLEGPHSESGCFREGNVSQSCTESNHNTSVVQLLASDLMGCANPPRLNTLKGYIQFIFLRSTKNTTQFKYVYFLLQQQVSRKNCRHGRADMFIKKRTNENCILWKTLMDGSFAYVFTFLDVSCTCLWFCCCEQRLPSYYALPNVGQAMAYTTARHYMEVLIFWHTASTQPTAASRHVACRKLVQSERN